MICAVFYGKQIQAQQIRTCSHPFERNPNDQKHYLEAALVV